MTAPHVPGSTGSDDDVEILLRRLDLDARSALDASRRESQALGHDLTSSAHLVLAILREPGGLSYRALAANGMAYEDCQAFVAALVGMGDRAEHADTSEGGRFAEDIIVPLRAVSASNGEASLPDLLLEVVRDPGPVTRPLLQSYAVTTQSLEAFFATVTAEHSRANSSIGAVPIVGMELASRFAHDLVRTAMAERLTLDGFTWTLLTSPDRDVSRAGLALASLDAPCVDVANLLELFETVIVADDPDEAHNSLTAVAARATHWLPRTGDRRVDSVHLLLAAMEHSPRADFAAALKAFGITDDLLVAAAVEVRRDTGPQDRSGLPDTLAANGMRGPAPTLLTAGRTPAPQASGRRWTRRLLRSSMPSGNQLNTDLQVHRLWLYSLVSSTYGIAWVTYGVLLAEAAIRTGNWWLLGALPLGRLDPAVVPVPVWLGAALTVVWFVPQGAQVMLVLMTLCTALSTWAELQWRRSGTADPTYGLARRRRDTRTSFRSLMMGVFR